MDQVHKTSAALRHLKNENTVNLLVCEIFSMDQKSQYSCRIANIFVDF